MKSALWSGLLIAALSPLAATAEGIPVTPGLWEMSFTVEMPMLPQPQVTQEQECVEETELGLDTFEFEDESTCAFSDVARDGNTLAWSLRCQGEMGEMQGHWRFSSEGDSMRGEGSMSFDAGGEQPMDMTMHWQGRRIGDCDPAQASQ